MFILGSRLCSSRLDNMRNETSNMVHVVMRLNTRLCFLIPVKRSETVCRSTLVLEAAWGPVT